MKYILLGFFLLINVSANKYTYLIKIQSSACSTLGGKRLVGYKLELSAKRHSKNNQNVLCGYEYDKIFSVYTQAEKVEILEELLSFEGDTSVCAKDVCNYGSKYFKRPITKTYTTQIDALYLFTILTVSSYSPNYCPFPVLYDNETDTEINNDQKKISKIFKIYRKWFNENKEKGFVDYNVPLRDKRFEWFSTQKDFKYDKDDFKIARLDRSARVVGICKD